MCLLRIILHEPIIPRVFAHNLTQDPTRMSVVGLDNNAYLDQSGVKDFCETFWNDEGSHTPTYNLSFQLSHYLS